MFGLMWNPRAIPNLSSHTHKLALGMMILTDMNLEEYRSY